MTRDPARYANGQNTRWDLAAYSTLDAEALYDHGKQSMVR